MSFSFIVPTLFLTLTLPFLLFFFSSLVSFYNYYFFVIFWCWPIFFFFFSIFFFILVIAGSGKGKGKKAAASDDDDGEEEPEMMESGGTVAGIDSSHFALRFVRTKDGELTYQCGLCGYLPNSTNKSIGYAKSRVCMHIKNVHSEPTNVVCPRCAKKFKNKESLRVHRIKYCRDLAGNLATA